MKAVKCVKRGPHLAVEYKQFFGFSRLKNYFVFRLVRP